MVEVENLKKVTGDKSWCYEDIPVTNLLNILQLQSQYMYSIVLFIIKNKDQFPPNSHMHTINTRHNNNLHEPSANLTVYKRGVYYSGIKIFNHLPIAIKNLYDNKKKLQIALRKFLLFNSFYSVEEYYSSVEEASNLAKSNTVSLSKSFVMF